MSLRSATPNRRISIVLLAMTLAGCGGLLPAPPERQLYRLSPQPSFPTPLPRVRAQLLVAAPRAAAGIDSRRIALSRTPVSLDYFAGAEWADRVPFVVQSALVEGFERSGAVPGVGTEAQGLRADFVLDTEVRDFEAVYDSLPGGTTPEKSAGPPPRARVVLDVQLIAMPNRRIVARTAVSREAPAAANTVPDIVRAFEAALGLAVRDLVTWTVTNPALSARSR